MSRQSSHWKYGAQNLSLVASDLTIVTSNLGFRSTRENFSISKQHTFKATLLVLAEKYGIAFHLDRLTIDTCLFWKLLCCIAQMLSHRISFLRRRYHALQSLQTKVFPSYHQKNINSNFINLTVSVSESQWNAN